MGVHLNPIDPSAGSSCGGNARTSNRSYHDAMTLFMWQSATQQDHQLRTPDIILRYSKSITTGSKIQF